MTEGDTEPPSGEKRVEGHYYPDPHPAWGGFAEELFHYTSRYYSVTEAFLRTLTELYDFDMSAYKAHRLSQSQLEAMAAVLAYAPDSHSGLAVVSLVETVKRGEKGVANWLRLRFPLRHSRESPEAPVGHVRPGHPLEVAPLEPWLSLAERLMMPVAVQGRHVDVEMVVLTRHLDARSRVLRSNLQQAILDLHEAGYVLRNHRGMR